jgi:hypothetical protein
MSQKMVYKCDLRANVTIFLAFVLILILVTACAKTRNIELGCRIFDEVAS